MSDPVTLLIVGGLALAAAFLLKPKPDTPVSEEQLPTYSERGAYIPWIIGRRMVQPIICWVGDRKTEKEDAEGAKGIFGGDQKIRVFYEGAWHQLAVGPGYSINLIEQQGEPIFAGPITRETHPTGTVIDLGSEGSFMPVWGHPDDPPVTYLDANGRVKVASAWPYCFGVVWLRKRLGTVPQWKVLAYDITVRPFVVGLSMSSPWMSETRELSGETYPIVRAVSKVSDWFFEVSGDEVQRFPVLSSVKLSGPAIADQEVIVNALKYREDKDRTKVWVNAAIANVDVVDTAEPFNTTRAEGVNGAHAIYQLLHAPWPHGMGFSTDYTDLDSLEAVGALLQTEGFPQSFVGASGGKGEEILAKFMEDAGVLAPQVEGKLRFVPVRDPTGTPVPTLPEGVMVPPLPEVHLVSRGIVLESADRLTFTFSDRQRRFKKNTAPVDDDGLAVVRNNRRTRTVHMDTVIDIVTASKAALRRSQGDLASSSTQRIAAVREARYLIPGQAVVWEGIPQVHRIVQIKLGDQKSEIVEIESTPDVYGVPPSTFLHDGGGGNPTPSPQAELDIEFLPFEVPGWFTSDGVTTVVIPRIRASDEIRFADLYISEDDVTYDLLGRTFEVQAGAELDEALAADSLFELDEGPLVTALGDEIEDLPDLTGDDAAWRRGELLVAIGGEIMFAKKVTSMGGDQWRIDGLLRARIGFDREAHAIGANVAFWTRDALDEYAHPLLETPNVTRYFKTRPSSDTGSVLLSDVTAVSRTIYGEAYRPRPVLNLRTYNLEGGSPGYAPGATIVFAWEWWNRNNREGAGFSETPGDPITFVDPPGFFRLRFYDTTFDVLYGEYTVVGLPVGFSYSAAERDTDYGTENPAGVRLRITHVEGSYESDVATLDVPRVDP